MNQLREFLRHQYIGAIVIGLLLYQGITSIIPATVGPIFYFIRRNADHSVLSSERPPIPWDTLFQNLVQAVLLFLLAWVMLRWLYVPKPEASDEFPAESAE